MITALTLVATLIPGFASGANAIQVTGTSNSMLKASCNIGETPLYAGFDPANGLIYVDMGPTMSSPNDSIIILEPPCNIIKTISLPSSESGPCGVVYDPVVKEVVVGDEVGNAGQGVGYLIKGISLVRTIPLGGDEDHTPCALTWDPAIKSVLFSDTSRGIDTVELSITSGKLNVETNLDAFDRNSFTVAALVQDGYLYCANADINDQVRVYDASTLSLIGDFNFTPHYGAINSIAWDPLNRSVVLGLYGGNAQRVVAFLDSSSIAMGKFSHSFLYARGIFDQGVSSVVYSPSTQLLYFGVAAGDDVWMLSQFGTLSHVYLGGSDGVTALVYDSLNQNVYAVGLSGKVSVLG